MGFSLLMVSSGSLALHVTQVQVEQQMMGLNVE